MKTLAFKFPKLGRKREYKTSIEKYWKKIITEQELNERLSILQKDISNTYKSYDIDIFPFNDISKYDYLFDTAIMTGVYNPETLDNYFELCRGGSALEMKKWFNTNYHYLVPNLQNEDEFNFKFNPDIFGDFKKYNTVSVIGPFTFLKLSKNVSNFSVNLKKLVNIYSNLFDMFSTVILEEPSFVLELSTDEINLIKEVYSILGKNKGNSKLYIISYYEDIDFLTELYDLPVDGIGIDIVKGTKNLDMILKNGFPEDKELIIGCVDGTNIWRTEIDKVVEKINSIRKIKKNIIISNAGPLFHLPISVENESNIENNLINKIAFAEERLKELNLILKKVNGKEIEVWNHKSDFGIDVKVKERVSNLTEKDFNKSTNSIKRKTLQKERLNLPEYPTTTIGSFPQTSEARKIRRKFKLNKISSEDYDNFVKSKIKDLISKQEELNLDVFVHGEFERSDMVEFFAEKLNGIATTDHGWIISFGSRVYRPPIIFGDISRKGNMTLKEIKFAQTLTEKPVKGMLTGPVTIIAWSFERKDIPIKNIAYQLGLVILDEIKELENAGIKIVQIDEPAIREKAPIKKSKWSDYFSWAVNSFNLATNTKPETQIHTHMCYSKFDEIINEILKMNFDVISIEASRNSGGIVTDFPDNFKRQIGIGVWDIHSPMIPDIEQMEDTIKKVKVKIPYENIWINPDCGLKTRKWEEVIPSLKNMVSLAYKLRENK
ncbi:5-methyltetrahydropteroyltriglutamate--homocysteine S-methyltransferase [Candidatus Dependentiae bacterium]|nr:5-methyltetrahydropteroyltriglutamate--homocysteine S-methyltransferase [Candidatus Dependentiae bacterium]